MYGMPSDPVRARPRGARLRDPGTIFPDDAELLERLRAGDEQVFSQLLRRYHGPMVQVALSFVHDRATAEDVVQEAWIGVLKGIDGFEGRSSFKTWLFRILTNCAKGRAVRDSRVVPFSHLAGSDAEDQPTVDPDRFLGQGDRWAAHWASFPRAWDGIPEERLESAETFECVRDAIADLPANQRSVITMRYIQGWSSQEVCEALEITPVNQRVLLHRARAKVQEALERYLDEAPARPSPYHA